MRSELAIEEVLKLLTRVRQSYVQRVRHATARWNMLPNLMAAHETDNLKGVVFTGDRPVTDSGSELATSQPVTGFEPQDRHSRAPDRVPNAREAFRPAPPVDAAIVVDPIGAVSDKERKDHREKIDGIVQAQRDAETLVGVSLRR